MIPVITGTSVTTIGSGGPDGVFFEGRTVTLSPYRMAKHETTWELWDAVVRAGETASKGYTFTDGSGWQGYDAAGTSTPVGTGLGPNKEKRPVTMVTWYDVIAWCNLYSEVSGLQPVYYTSSTSGVFIKNATAPSDFATAYMDRSKNGFRLPTEAEWEFAARGGDPGAVAWNYAYAGSNTLGDVAWYRVNAGDSMFGIIADFGAHPVGTKPATSTSDNWANSLGLYDMSGNVMEWCWDGAEYPITGGTVTDPTGVDFDSARSLRGGGWCDDDVYCMVTTRYFSGASSGSSVDFGFRVVCP
jgi:formylglycine-generating enzyme required for sulfatase activity